MLSFTGGLVILAALLHAAWNAMLHGNRDRFLSMTWMSMAIASVSTIVVMIAPWPADAAWPYIVASGLVHIVYNVSLVRAYRSGDLGQTYPIARGSSPLLVTLGAAFFAHEAIGPLHAAGIVMISGGIISLALQGRHVSRSIPSSTASVSGHPTVRHFRTPLGCSCSIGSCRCCLSRCADVLHCLHR